MSDLVPEELEEDSEDEDAAIVAIIFLPKICSQIWTQHAEFLDHGNFNYSTVILFLERVQGKER